MTGPESKQDESEECCKECSLRMEAIDKAGDILDEHSNITLSFVIRGLLKRMFIYRDGEIVSFPEDAKQVWPAGGDICIEYFTDNSDGKED